jgi:hypothetical protein
MAPTLKLPLSSGSKKEEPRCARLSEAKASHSQRIWVEVSSSSAPHRIHKGLPVNPIQWRCLLRVLCPVRRSVTTLDFVLLKDFSLVLAVGLGSEINSRTCLWVLPRHSVAIVCFASLCDVCALMASIEHRCWKFLSFALVASTRSLLTDQVWLKSFVFRPRSLHVTLVDVRPFHNAGKTTPSFRWSAAPPASNS